MHAHSHPEIDERLSHAEQVEQIKSWRRNNVAAWAARTRALLEKKPASGPTDAGAADTTDSETLPAKHTLP